METSKAILGGRGINVLYEQDDGQMKPGRAYLDADKVVCGINTMEPLQITDTTQTLVGWGDFSGERQVYVSGIGTRVYLLPADEHIAQ